MSIECHKLVVQISSAKNPPKNSSVHTESKMVSSGCSHTSDCPHPFTRPFHNYSLLMRQYFDRTFVCDEDKTCHCCCHCCCQIWNNPFGIPSLPFKRLRRPMWFHWFSCKFDDSRCCPSGDPLSWCVNDIVSKYLTSASRYLYGMPSKTVKVYKSLEMITHIRQWG